MAICGNAMNKKRRHKVRIASYVILERDSTILMLRRHNTGYEDGKYSFIAGHVEARESCTEAALREAREEAGIYLELGDLQVAHILHRLGPDDEVVDVFYRAQKWHGRVENREPHKCDDVRWVDWNNLPANTIGYIRHTLNQIRQGVQYSEYGW